MIGNSKRGPKQWVLLSGRKHRCALFRLAFGRIAQVLLCSSLRPDCSLRSATEQEPVLPAGSALSLHRLFCAFCQAADLPEQNLANGQSPQTPIGTMSFLSCPRSAPKVAEEGEAQAKAAKANRMNLCAHREQAKSLVCVCDFLATFTHWEGFCSPLYVGPLWMSANHHATKSFLSWTGCFHCAVLSSLQVCHGP